jgi:hypothetical protein
MKKGRFLRRFWDYHTAMKILIISLSILLVSFQVEAIGKKKSKEDPKDVKIDSLTKVSQHLTVQLDSVSKELVKYQGVYTTLKDKVIHYNFDPSRTGVLIDSLRTSRDSTSALSSNMAKSDSIFMVLNDNKILKNRCDSIKFAWEKYQSDNTAEDVEKAKAIGSLKQLNELLASKIITAAEYTLLKKKYLEKL